MRPYPTASELSTYKAMSDSHTMPVLLLHRARLRQGASERVLYRRRSKGLRSWLTHPPFLREDRDPANFGHLSSCCSARTR
jgi:hypothetical protein